MTPHLSIDITHRALSKRLHISAGTSNKRTRDRYRADIFALIEDRIAEGTE